VRLAIFALALAACWRGEPAAPEPAPAVTWRRPVRIPAPAAATLDLADPDVLATTLRTQPHVALIDNGPIVLVDFDNGTMGTLCGRQARDFQDTWGAMLVDPARGAPTCGRGPTAMTCMQISDRPLLILYFTKDPPIRPTVAMTGTTPSRSALGVQSLTHATKNARCP